MNYNLTLVHKGDFSPTYWSGGMATELTTYPENSSYSERNFLWRLGFANIDIPESTFSTLPNISRTLMVTNGRLTLNHEGQHTACLGPFEQDSFQGEWKTTTKGQASVFNLMTQDNYSGELIHLPINPSCNKKFSHIIPFEKQLAAVCVYTLSGVLSTKINNHNLTLKSGELLRLDVINSSNKVDFKFTNSSKEILNMVIAIIYK